MDTDNTAKAVIQYMDAWNEADPSARGLGRLQCQSQHGRNSVRHNLRLSGNGP